MSKMKETIAKICSTIAIIPIASLTFIACTAKNDDNKPENAENTSNISNPGTPSNPNNPGITDDNNEVHSLSGIYSLTREFDVNDIVYENEEKLIEFFNTKDINGVKQAAIELGFNEFANKIMKFEDKNISVLFTPSKAQDVNSVFQYVIIDNLSFTYTDYALHEYKATENGYVTGEDEPIISFDAEKNEVTLLYQFCYKGEDGQTVETPLYFKTILAYNENTVGINGTEDDGVIAYKYKQSSSFLNISENHVKYENMMKEVATRLGIEGEATTENISAFFSDDKIMFVLDSTLNRLYYLLHSDMSVNIVPITESTKTYDFLGMNFEVLESKNEGEVRLSADLDSEVKFEITLTKLVVEA